MKTAHAKHSINMSRIIDSTQIVEALSNWLHLNCESDNCSIFSTKAHCAPGQKIYHFTCLPNVVV